MKKQGQSVAPSRYQYQVGGSLPFDAPSYVRRQADNEFYDVLSAGQFCYVLNSRQMGKSSLRVQVMNRLQREGYLCISIDISGFGTQEISSTKWYAGIINELVANSSLKQSFDWKRWWRSHQDLVTPVQQLKLFIEQVLLPSVQSPIVIFIDEIDHILSQGVSADDFLALIRYFYNQRVDHPHFHRLTFAILGVVTPSNLMANDATTAFNIGTAIQLQGFQPEEATALRDGLIHYVEDPDRVLAEIFDWTNGQPFLTQRLCSLVVEASTCGSTVNVAEIVKQRILHDWEAQDEPIHLRTLRDRTIHGPSSIQLLSLYRQVRQNRYQATHNAVEKELRLSGLVTYQQGYIQVFNRIYAEIFTEAWVEDELRKIRPYAIALNQWIQSGKHPKYLLKDEELSETLIWQADKKLSEQDHEFIISSQSLAQQVRQRKKIIRRVVAGVGLMAFASLLTAGVIQFRTRQTEQYIRDIELISLQGQKDFNANRLQSALTSALTAGEKLKSLVKEQPITEYPTTVPLRLLYQVIEQYQQSNPDLSPQVRSDKIEEEAIWDLDVHPRDGILAIAGVGNTIRLVQTDPLQTQSTRCQPDTGTIISLDFSSRFPYLASASFDGQIFLWDLTLPQNCQTSRPLAIIDSQQQAILEILFSPNGSVLASAGWNGTIKLWSHGGTLLAATPQTHQGPVRTIDFSPDQHLLASGGEDGQILLWRLCQRAKPCESGALSPELMQSWGAHQGWVWSIDFHPRSKQLVSVGEDGVIRLWATDGTEMLAQASQQGRTTQVSFNSDGTFIATAGWDGAVRLWAIRRKQNSLEMIAEWKGGKPITSLRFSPSGESLIAGDVTGQIKIWSIHTLSSLLREGHQLLETQSQPKPQPQL